jgi:hypothetical protein
MDWVMVISFRALCHAIQCERKAAAFKLGGGTAGQ